MGVNGISHHVVEDDFEGVTALLRWLSFVPTRTGLTPPLLPSPDPVDRDIGYVPALGRHRFLPSRRIICCVTSSHMALLGWD